MTFQGAYVAKRRSEAAWKGQGKPFGGSAIFGAALEKTTDEQLRRRGNPTTAGPSPITNQMMDLIEGYLDNIAVVATQTASKGGTLAELAASLEISVDTVMIYQQEIKRFSEQVNALKNRGTQATSFRTLPRGVLVRTTVCTHCEAVGRTDPVRKNACYFNPRKITHRKERARKLMDENVVGFKDDE